jgi:hypothetical protein
LLADLNVVSPVIRHDEDRGLVEMEFRRRARHWAEKDPAKKTLERLEALLPAVVLSAMVSVTQIDEEVLGPDLGVLAKEKPDDEGVVTDAGAHGLPWRIRSPATTRIRACGEVRPEQNK